MRPEKNPTYRKADTCANCALSDIMAFGGEDKCRTLVCTKYEQKVTRYNVCDDHERTEEYI